MAITPIKIEHLDNGNTNTEIVRLLCDAHDELAPINDKDYGNNITRGETVFVCRSSGKIVGILFYSEFPENCLYIELAYTIPEYRKRGIFTKPFKALERKAHKERRVAIYSGILDPNQSSKDVHLTLGFKPTHTYFKYGIIK